MDVAERYCLNNKGNQAFEHIFKQIDSTNYGYLMDQEYHYVNEERLIKHIKPDICVFDLNNPRSYKFAKTLSKDGGYKGLSYENIFCMILNRDLSKSMFSKKS